MLDAVGTVGSIVDVGGACTVAGTITEDEVVAVSVFGEVTGILYEANSVHGRTCAKLCDATLTTEDEVGVCVHVRVHVLSILDVTEPPDDRVSAKFCDTVLVTEKVVFDTCLVCLMLSTGEALLTDKVEAIGGAAIELRFGCFSPIKRDDVDSMGNLALWFLFGTPPFLPTPLGMPCVLIAVRFGWHFLLVYQSTNEHKSPFTCAVMRAN